MVLHALSHKPRRANSATSGAPSLTGRALLALVFLLGFYVLAFAAVAVLIGLNVALYVAAGRVSAQMVIVTVVVTGAILRGVFFITRSDDADLPGVPVDERSQPELVGLVGAVAKDMGTAAPDRILLVPEVNASVTETGGLLGLRRGERVMVLGVPLMHSLTVDQLRGVIAHELGHYAGGDTRLGALTYRAGASIYRTVDNLGHDSLLGRLFSAYGHRYLLISQRVRRQQELSADAAAVRLAGRGNHISALRRVEGTVAAFDHFVRYYLAPLWRNGCDAENAFEGYGALLADPKRAEQLTKIEAAAHDRVADPYDSHPSLAERVASAERLPEGPSAGHDGRPARTLLADADRVEREVGAFLTRMVTGREMERLVAWDAAAADIYAEDLRHDGAALLRAAGTVAGDPYQATLATAVALIEGGRADELVSAIAGPLDEWPADERAEMSSAILRQHLAGAIGSYLTAERGHTWAVSWSGPLGVVDGDGKHKDPFAMASSLVEDPSSGGRLRRALGGVSRLRGFRAVEVADAPVQQDPERPTVVHVVPDVVADRRHVDLLLTTSTVVLHPIAGGMGYAMRRLMSTQGVSGPQALATQRRVEALFARPAEELLGEAGNAVVLAFGDIRQLRKRRGGGIQIDVAGRPKPVRLRCPAKKERDLLLAAMQEQLVAQGAGAGHAVAV